MDMEPPDPGALLVTFVNIQREIFINVCALFGVNVGNKNKSLFKRAVDFSKDFNNCDEFNFEHLALSEQNFPQFCEFSFDFINYVRKIDETLYKDSIEFARSQMKFPTMPTLDMSVHGCTQSIGAFLDMRENNKLPCWENNGDNEENDEQG